MEYNFKMSLFKLLPTFFFSTAIIAAPPAKLSHDESPPTSTTVVPGEARGTAVIQKQNEFQIGRAFYEDGIFKFSPNKSHYSLLVNLTKEELDAAQRISAEFYRTGTLWDVNFQRMKKDRKEMLAKLDFTENSLEREYRSQSSAGNTNAANTILDQLSALKKQRTIKFAESDKEFNSYLEEFSRHLSKTLRQDNLEKSPEYWYELTRQFNFPRF